MFRTLFVIPFGALLAFLSAGCPGVETPTGIPAGTYVGTAECSDSEGIQTTLSAILRVNEDGWPLGADGELLQIGSPLELPSGGGFEFDGQISGLDVDGEKIVENWSYTATSTIRENESYVYIATKTSWLLSDGRISVVFTQTGAGFDPAVGQYVTYNQSCSGVLSR